MITVFFAPPGVGKTSLAARFAWWQWFRSKFGKSKYLRVYANFPLKHTYTFEKSDIGIFDFCPPDEEGNFLMLMDEAGIDFNSRRFKEMTDQQIQHFKEHRHHSEDWYVFSQSFDVDKVLRDLTPELRYLKKCWFWPHTIKSLRIHKSMIVDDTSHQLLDGYEFDPPLLRLFTTKRYYLPPYWGMFDSWSKRPLKYKDFRRCE